MTYLEYGDQREIFTEHAFPEHLADLGEIRMNYAVAGESANPALLLIPGQTESWWGYEEAMRLLADRFQVYAVDLRGQGRSTWTPGRYSLDNFGGDLVRFIDRVIARPVVVSGLSSGGVIAAWLSAFALPGQVRAAVYEDPPLFASEVNPAVGQSIRQTVAGPMFRLWHKWLGPQWSIADESGMVAAMGRELPGWMFSAMQMAAPPGGLPAGMPPGLREYDPEWADAFYSGRVGVTCDHENMLAHVTVPILFTHHFHAVEPETGNLIGASSDDQVRHVRRLVEGAGNSFTYRSFPDMPHSMHGHDPATYATTVIEWVDSLSTAPTPGRSPEAAAVPSAASGAVPGAASSAGGVPGHVDGIWAIAIQTPMGEQRTRLTLVSSGTELTGILNESAIEAGRVDGTAIRFKARLTSPVNAKISCEATVDGDTMTGRAKALAMPITVTFTGTRVAAQ